MIPRTGREVVVLIRKPRASGDDPAAEAKNAEALK